jgi:protein-S-isoprenylcysteine O-methyltransferase Ste14
MQRDRIANAAIGPVVFLLPLLGNTARLAHPGPWIGTIVTIILVLTQPSKGDKKVLTDPSDRLSALGIVVGGIGSQLVAVIDFGYRAEMRPAPVSALVLGGLLLAAAGLVLRLWAIRTLGRFFTVIVTCVPDQKVVRDGPYRILRHPSYTGAVLAAAGVVITLGSLVGLAVVVALVVPAYLYRIRVEEAALIGGLGEEYRAYRTHTWRLIPYLF